MISTQVYCNNPVYGDKLELPLTSNKDDVSLLLYIVNDNISIHDFTEALDSCYTMPLKTFVYVESGSQIDFVKHFIRFTPNVFSDYKSLECFMCEADFATYSICECVESSICNYGIDCTTSDFMVSTVERCLRIYGVYAVVVSFVTMLDSKHIVPTMLEASIKRNLAMYRRVSSSYEVFRQTGSHFLSVLSTVNVQYVGNWIDFENVVLHALLSPYVEGDTVQERVDLIARIVKMAN